MAPNTFSASGSAKCCWSIGSEHGLAGLGTDLCRVNVLSAENLHKSWNEKILFQGITFGLSKGDKVALVAANGSGKTSLLNILTQKDKPDQGVVSIRKDIHWAYLSQDPDLDDQASILDNVFLSDAPAVCAVRDYEAALEQHSIKADAASEKALDAAMEAVTRYEAWDLEAKAKTVLGKLNIHNVTQSVAQLSGGQRKRLALARVLLEEPDLLIMDEPTNHLDIDMIEWLEEQLMAKSLTLLLVTHDRYFLDRICQRIVELDKGDWFEYLGNYAYYIEQKHHRYAVAQAEQEKAHNLYRRELEWVRRMPKARTTKSKSRVEAFEDISERAKKKYQDEATEFGVKMERMGSKILELHHLEKAFEPDTCILEDFTYTFKRGEKIGIVGPNGVGKSTFLNMIMGLERPDKGKIVAGETMVFGYFDQKPLVAPDDMRVIDVLRELAEYLPMADGSRLPVAQFLRRFGFANETHYQWVGKLSGGEKRRLQLLKVLVTNPNFLILDEPTNDLDIVTLATLESFLIDYPGCVLIVSHDRYFMDKLVDHVFVFQGQGQVKDYPGNYSDYRSWADAEKLRLQQEKAKPSPVALSQTVATVDKPASETRKLSFKEKFEYEQIEKELPQLQARKKALETELAGLTSEFERIQSVSAELAQLNEELDSKELRWLELSEGL